VKQTKITEGRRSGEKVKNYCTRLYAFFETFAESPERTGAEIFMRKATCV